MDVWHLALYAVASFLALRSLISLMTQHKRRYIQGLLAEESRHRKKRKAEPAQPAAEAPESAEAAA